MGRRGDGGGSDSASAAASNIPQCPRCTQLFDGTTFNGFEQGPGIGWEIKDGALSALGKKVDIWTKEDFGNYRIVFSVRQIKGGHRPGVLFFGKHPKPEGPQLRGLYGIQWQVPYSSHWDYRGEGGDPTGGNGRYSSPGSLSINVRQWHRCEALVKEAGEIRGACCNIEGKASCQAVEVFRFVDPTIARKAPFGMQMHDENGSRDEYKDIWLEVDPMVDDLLTTK